MALGTSCRSGTKPQRPQQFRFRNYSDYYDSIGYLFDFFNMRDGLLATYLAGISTCHIVNIRHDLGSAIVYVGVVSVSAIFSGKVF